MVWTLASDIDGTLVGDPRSLNRLAARLNQLRAAGELYLILSTGRVLGQVISGLLAEGLPQPDALLCQVGTEIYLPPLDRETPCIAAWREHLRAEYSRREAESFLEGVEGLVMQPAECNTELKTSAFLDGCPDPSAAAMEICRRIEPYADRYQAVWSSGRDMDILPASSGKGKAIQFLVDHQGLDPNTVVVAGDTGNDSTMFEHFGKGIVVANAQPELVHFLQLREASAEHHVHYARLPYAAGVQEGLEYFGLI